MNNKRLQTPIAGQARGLSIGTKLTSATLAVLVLVSVLLYRELTRRERQSLLAAKETAAMMVADLFAASLSAPLDFGDNEAIETELRHLETNAEVELRRRLPEGGEEARREARAWLRRLGARRRRAGGSGRLPRGSRRGDAPRRRPRERERRANAHRLLAGAGECGLRGESPAIFWLTFLLAAGTAAVLIVISRTQIVSPLGVCLTRRGASAVATSPRASTFARTTSSDSSRTSSIA